MKTHLVIVTMESKRLNLIFLLHLITILSKVNCYTYKVKIVTEDHVNIIDTKFLSFTVDPKYLFSSADKYNGVESVCMASLLAPAYLRIAGPSTSQMTFHNSTITFTDLNVAQVEASEEITKKNIQDSIEDGKEKKAKHLFGLKKKYSSLISGLDSDEEDQEQAKRLTVKNRRHSKYFDMKRDKQLSSKKIDEETSELSVTHSQWQNFVQWSNKTGFDLVFALNNEEKTTSGLWDPNSALNILTLAANANFSRIYWQLGYECSNQSIDEYLNDLETLQAIVDSYGSQTWGAVGGDVSKCIQPDSKSDFGDYLTLTDELMDAVVLDGKSSVQELQKMSEADRIQLIKQISSSSTPLWLVDGQQHLQSELLRAAEWMTSAGHSARNGFAVYFRELIEEELYEPTLSFYMALLHKHLVGEKVLGVNMEESEAVLFAHCTSLRHNLVPGAVTLFATNLDDETARFAIKMSKKEAGGEIMQFILGHDLNGNIIINGRAMFEGDIKPIVKRLRPYKTLLLNLPPKSFGFWVIANTKVDACQEDQEETKEYLEALSINDEDVITPESVKTKRSMITMNVADHDDVSMETFVKLSLEERIASLNNNLIEAKKLFEEKDGNSKVLHRRKRQIKDDTDIENKRKTKKFLRHLLQTGKTKSSDESKPRLDFIRKLFSLNPRAEIARHKDKVRNLNRINKTKTQKRNFKIQTEDENNTDSESNDNKHIRTRRNIIDEKLNKRDDSFENELDVDGKYTKLWNILDKIHRQLKDLPVEEGTDSGTVDILEEDKTDIGLLKSTLDSIVSVLNDLNKNLNRFWKSLTLLE